MEYRPLALGILALLITPISMAQQPVLELVTFDAPPYQVVEITGNEHRNVSGETVETVTCAAKKSGWPINITLAPQKRAIYSLKKNSVDGYFAANPSADLDAIASRSYPLALEKWFFFTLDPSPKPSLQQIGVVDGSNEEAWLKANGYKVYLSVTSPSQLLALLERGRIDAALMDVRVMEWLNAKNGLVIEGLNSHFLRYAPLHFYVAKAFHETHPEFLSAFNQALSSCTAKTLTPTRREIKHIESLTKRLLAELTQLLNIQEALKNGPQPSTLAEVLNIDNKWQALAPMTMPPLAAHVLALPASKTLDVWQSSYQGLITEVMLVNRIGSIAAMSQLTSDFWQGDELKFLEVAGPELTVDPRDRKPFFISPIRYDQSTKRFQITVSSPVLSDGDSTPNGVIVIGLDIEKAMAI